MQGVVSNHEASTSQAPQALVQPLPEGMRAAYRQPPQTQPQQPPQQQPQQPRRLQRLQRQANGHASGQAIGHQQSAPGHPAAQPYQQPPLHQSTVQQQQYHAEGASHQEREAEHVAADHRPAAACLLSNSSPERLTGTAVAVLNGLAGADEAARQHSSFAHLAKQSCTLPVASSAEVTPARSQPSLGSHQQITPTSHAQQYIATMSNHMVRARSSSHMVQLTPAALARQRCINAAANSSLKQLLNQLRHSSQASRASTGHTAAASAEGTVCLLDAGIMPNVDQLISHPAGLKICLIGFEHSEQEQYAAVCSTLNACIISTHQLQGLISTSLPGAAGATLATDCTGMSAHSKDAIPASSSTVVVVVLRTSVDLQRLEAELESAALTLPLLLAAGVLVFWEGYGEGFLCSCLLRQGITVQVYDYQMFKRGVAVVAGSLTLQHCHPEQMKRMLDLLRRGQDKAQGVPAEWQLAVRLEDVQYAKTLGTNTASSVLLCDDYIDRYGQ